MTKDIVKNSAIDIERIYNKSLKNDVLNGQIVRILIDRLWPRGLKKEDANIDIWEKDIAPSITLRKWYSHDEKKWEEFKSKYIEELKKNKEIVDKMLEIISQYDRIILLYGSKSEKFNNAIVLKQFLDERLKKS